MRRASELQSSSQAKGTCPRLAGVLQVCVVIVTVVKLQKKEEDSPPENGSFFPKIFKFSGKIPFALGIGATAARHALDVEIGVRIPDPQPSMRAEKEPSTPKALFVCTGVH